MSRLMIILVLISVMAGISQSAAASRRGVSQEALERAGWECLEVGDIHCVPPGGLARVFSAEAEVMTAFVFSTSDSELLGTEQIIRSDLFKDQPCPTDPPSQEYTDLEPLLGIPYFACHRFDSSF